MSENQFSELAERHAQAISAWRMIFEKQYPAPVRRVMQMDNRIQIATLLLVVVAAIIVSASHTVPVFMRGTGALTGVAAFIMLEFGLVALTYQRTREKTIRDGTNETSFKWITYAIGLTLLILLIGNVYQVGFEYGFTHPVIDLIVVISVGVSAPALAFVSGEALALESVKALLMQRELDAEYAAQQMAYNESFVEWWNARKGRIVKVEREPVNLVQSVNLTEKTDKQPRISPKTEKAFQWFMEHPEHLKTPSRELVELIGVSHVTIFNVQQELIKRSNL